MLNINVMELQKTTNVNFSFEKLKKNNSRLSHVNEGCYDYFDSYPNVEFQLKYKKWKQETEIKNKIRQANTQKMKPGECKDKANTGAFGQLFEEMITGKKSSPSRKTDTKDGDIKSNPIVKKKSGGWSFKEKPTICKIGLDDSVEVVKNKLEKGLVMGLFQHNPKSVFNRKFLTVIKLTFSSLLMKRILEDVKHYQDIIKKKGFGILNTHTHFLYEQGIYKSKDQIIHAKQGGRGKKQMKKDGTYHVNFSIANSVANKLILQNLTLENYLNNIIKK